MFPMMGEQASSFLDTNDTENNSCSNKTLRHKRKKRGKKRINKCTKRKSRLISTHVGADLNVTSMTWCLFYCCCICLFRSCAVSRLIHLSHSWRLYVYLIGFWLLLFFCMLSTFSNSRAAIVTLCLVVMNNPGVTEEISASWYWSVNKMHRVLWQLHISRASRCHEVTHFNNDGVFLFFL